MVYVYNWVKNLFQSKTRENIFSITCGDIVLFHLLGVPPEFTAFTEKMITTVILAALGGAAGWAGKELIMWGWGQIKDFGSYIKKKIEEKKK